MDILFVTVGTSAITNAGIGKVPGAEGGTKLRDNTMLRNEASRYLDSVPSRQMLRNWVSLRERLIQAHRDYWSMDTVYWNDPKNFLQTSAELTSTRFLISKEIVDRTFDRVYLLASDTEPGYLAADINCEVMKLYWGLKDVSVKRIPKLDREFVETFAAITHATAECGISDNDTVIFNITGGFKGTVPAITLKAQKEGWSIYYQHEDINRTVEISLANGEVKETPWGQHVKSRPPKI